MQAQERYAVIWEQGALVAPQHLQQQARYHDTQLQARLHALAPDAWGVLQLRCDALALSQGALSLTAAHLVLPDGQVLAWDESLGDAPVRRPLPARGPASGGPLAIYVAMPRVQPGRPNVLFAEREATASGATRASARFVAERTALHELTHADSAAVEIDLARPNVRLCWGDEMAPTLDGIQVLALRQGADGAWGIDAAFMPAALRLAAVPTLAAHLEHLQGRAAAADEALVTQLREQPLPAPLATLRLGALRALQAELQLLQHSPGTTPAAVHGTLLRAAAALGTAGLEPARMLAELPPYRHAEPQAALGPLLRLLLRLIAPPRRQQLRIPCALQPTGIWQATLGPVPGGLQWLLEVALSDRTADGAPLACDHPAMALAAGAWVRLAKLAAPSALPQLLRSALRGVALRPAGAQPERTHTTAGTLRFVLEQHHPAWARVCEEHALAIMPPAMPPHIAMQGTLVAQEAEGAP